MCTTQRSDLAWWLGIAPTLRWTTAATFADTAPHSYVVRGRTPELDAPAPAPPGPRAPSPSPTTPTPGPTGQTQFDRACRVIRTYGHPARYFSATLVYLHDPRNPTTKWWTMKGSIADQGVINRSTDGRTYGPQTAPRTGPEVPPVVGPHRPDAPASVYDALASSYDARYTRPGDLAENARIASLVTEHFGAYAPTTLDVGCGTGLLLDLRITSPAIYTGVDPSQGMLNHLLAKHPSVDRLVPAPVEEVPLDTLRPTPPSRTRGFDLVASLFGSPSYVAPHVIAALPALLAPGGLLLLMHYRPGYLPDYWAALAPHHRPDPDHVDASYEAARALPATHPALDVTHSTLGHFLVTRAARR